MSKGTTVLDLARKAKETFDRNIDTMIAAFLIRNPDVNPGDIELVFQPSVDGKMHFWINQCPAGVKLPSTKSAEGAVQEIAPADESDYREGWNRGCAYGKQQGHAAGWNECLDEVKRLNARTPEQLRSPLPGVPEDAVVLNV